MKRTAPQDYVCVLLAAIFYFGIASGAQAGIVLNSYNSGMQTGVCNVLIMASYLCSGIATLGVLALGITAALGKVSVGMGITIAAGISVMIGAASIASYMNISNSCT